MRHFIEVMRSHDLANKKTTTNTKTAKSDDYEACQLYDFYKDKDNKTPKIPKNILCTLAQI